MTGIGVLQDLARHMQPAIEHSHKRGRVGDLLQHSIGVPNHLGGAAQLPRPQSGNLAFRMAPSLNFMLNESISFSLPATGRNSPAREPGQGLQEKTVSELRFQFDGTL